MGRSGGSRDVSFDVDIGHCSRAGRRKRNEDFVAVLRAEPGDEDRGLIAALADGVATGGYGLEAAQTSVMSLVLDYFAAPDTWETTVVLDRLIGAQNSWLADHNRRRQGLRGSEGEAGAHGVGLTTLTALVLRGHAYTLAHVGDTRAWLLRGGESGDCVQLSQDHSFDHPDQRSRLTRAVGLDDRVRIDFIEGELQPDDVFVLTSDGVHGALSRGRLSQLARAGDAQAASEALVDAALEAGSDDNVTALVLQVRGLAAGRSSDSLLAARRVPVPAALKVGDRIDAYTITALVANNGVHRIYQARDGATQQLVALKTLHEARASDREERAMLAHEAWLAGRVAGGGGAAADGFVRVHDVRSPSAFYAVYDWHSGRTLDQWLAAGRRFEVAEVVAAALAIARALGRLHRLGIVHRDIKPANLHCDEAGVWRILDLGAAISGREPKALRTLHAGTPSFMNPEQWATDHHHPADAGSDLWALGATLYQWLTGKLPYGEVEPYQSARFRRDPKPPSRLRPDVPIWLDYVVLKAVALDPALRFETAEELMLALERGAARPLGAPGATPLLTRDPVALWRLALAVSLLFNALLVFWLLYLPR